MNAVRIFLRYNHLDLSCMPIDCGNAIENSAVPISALQHCDGIPTTFLPFPTTGSALMACTGNAKEFCGGPDIISIYTLPGTGIIPLIPFTEGLGGGCTANNCVGSE